MTEVDVIGDAAAGAPRSPGCYFMLGDHSEVLYAGKARDLRRRLRDHASAETAASYVRLRPLYTATREVRWVVLASDADALAFEADVIVALRPRFNAAIAGEGRWTYIVVTPDHDTAVRFELTSRPGARPARTHGCFPSLGAGVGSAPGIAVSDGYPALLRLLWSASPSSGGLPVPASIAGAGSLATVTLDVDPRLVGPLTASWRATALGSSTRSGHPSARGTSTPTSVLRCGATSTSLAASMPPDPRRCVRGAPATACRLVR